MACARVRSGIGGFLQAAVEPAASVLHLQNLRKGANLSTRVKATSSWRHAFPATTGDQRALETSGVKSGRYVSRRPYPRASRGADTVKRHVVKGVSGQSAVQRLFLVLARTPTLRHPENRGPGDVQEPQILGYSWFWSRSRGSIQSRDSRALRPFKLLTLDHPALLHVWDSFRITVYVGNRDRIERHRFRVPGHGADRAKHFTAIRDGRAPRLQGWRRQMRDYRPFASLNSVSGPTRRCQVRRHRARSDQTLAVVMLCLQSVQETGRCPGEVGDGSDPAKAGLPQRMRLVVSVASDRSWHPSSVTAIMSLFWSPNP